MDQPTIEPSQPVDVGQTSRALAVGGGLGLGALGAGVGAGLGGAVGLLRYILSKEARKRGFWSTLATGTGYGALAGGGAGILSGGIGGAMLGAEAARDYNANLPPKLSDIESDPDTRVV